MITYKVDDMGVTRYALPALMGLDLAGILLRWRTFDHFVSTTDAVIVYITFFLICIILNPFIAFRKAHLTGAMMGLGYMKYGPTNIWAPLLSNYQNTSFR
jgi:rhomboid-like protein